jgi:hypothetical protein
VKRIPRKFTIVVILLCIAYAVIFTIKQIGSGMIGVVENKQDKKVVRVVRNDPGSRAFVWQAAFPWWFTYYEVAAERAVLYDIKLSIPNLEYLKEDYYRITIPVRVLYRIDRQKFTDAAKLRNNCRELDGTVKRYFENALKKETHAFLYPAYQRETLVAQMNAIIERIKKDVGVEFQNLNLVLSGVSVVGGLSLPDRNIYNEGMLHAADLRKMDKQFEKGLREIRSSNDREKIKNELFYSKLLEISKIISRNPEILKYIYIDKLGGNVKLILSSDRTGLPALLEEAKKPGKGKPGEIDNLK